MRLWHPGEPTPDWQAGWIVVHSPDPDGLRIYGTFVDESAMWQALGRVPFGQPGAEVYLAVPATEQQIRQLIAPEANLGPFSPYARQARKHAGGILRLMQIAPGRGPLWLGEPVPA